MAIQDRDSYRLNTTLTSLAFIIYFVAGGSFEGKITLQVINLEFAKPEIWACKPNCVNAHSLKFPEKENHYEQHRPRKTQSHGR